MTTEEIRLKAYNTIKQQLDAAFSQGGIPNIKQFRKTIKDLKRRIGILIDGTELFARSEEDVEYAIFFVESNQIDDKMTIFAQNPKG